MVSPFSRQETALHAQSAFLHAPNNLQVACLANTLGIKISHIALNTILEVLLSDRNDDSMLVQK